MSDLEHIAIERLKTASEMSLQYYGQPLIITDSGGKDSAVCKELALRSGIPFEVMRPWMGRSELRCRRCLN